LGEEVLFEPSGDRLWSQLRDQLNTLLLALLQSGALRGATPEDAFLVRCDRTTMTTSDLDSGRLIAEIQFTPAVPIEQITIVLAMDEGGQVSLISR
jgi:phage tail sheath protein FI